MLVVAVGVSVLWWRQAGVTDDGGDAKELLNRVWIDAWPGGEREMREALVLIDQPGNPTARIGGFGRSSRWRGAFEAFVFMPPRGGKVAIRYPQDGREEIARYQVSPCQGDRFNRCLTLEGNSRGVHRYRSNDDLIIRPRADAPGVPDAASIQRQIESAAAANPK